MTNYEVDWRLLPALLALYTRCFIDRSNSEYFRSSASYHIPTVLTPCLVGNAKIAEMNEGLSLAYHLYNLA